MKPNSDKFLEWLNKRLDKLKSLKPFQNKPESDLLINIIKSLWSDEDDAKIKLGYLYDSAKNDEEKKFLIESLKHYETDFEFKQSDESDLRQLLTFELELRRLQLQAVQGDKSNLTIIETLQNLSETLRDLKTKLGIIRGQRESTKDSVFELFTRTKQAALKYITEHNDEFMWKCSQCSAIHLLARRHSAYDDEGGLWSLQLITFYNEKKLTLQEVASVLETSTEYLRAICFRKGIKLREENEEKT